MYEKCYLGAGVPCVVCRDTLSSSDVRQGCWDREHQALEQHISLGRLVQWWGIMGLLPKYPGKDIIIHCVGVMSYHNCSVLFDRVLTGFSVLFCWCQRLRR